MEIPVFYFTNMGSLNDSILPKFVCFIVGFYTYVFSIFGLMNKLMFRLKGVCLSPESKLNLDTVQQISDTMIDSDVIGLEKQADDEISVKSKFDAFKNNEEPESFLSFKFQRYEEFIDGAKGINGEFISPKPEQVDDEHEEVDSLSGSSSDEEWYEPSYDPIILEDSDGSLCDGDDNLNVCSKAASLQVDENRVYKAEKVDDHWDFKPFGDEGYGFEVLLGSDLQSVESSSNFSLRSSLLDSIKDGYLSSSSSSSDDAEDEDDDDKIDLSILKRFETDKEHNNNNQQSTQLQEEAEFHELSKGYEAEDVEEDKDLLVELKNIEEDVAKEKRVDGYVKSREVDSPEEDDLNGMETQWEHQNLIEQLKMEISKVKEIGLPTIFEDSEDSKMADDLKPWKIDEKLFRTSGTMDEVHKFYKSYRERMRKFDIFNYQKMYAIGFLRLKDPLLSFSPQKISLATIVSQDCWPCKPKSSGTSNYSVVKLTRELESDLETVYVGQLCLSWEFLRWEYGKALALWDSDPHEIRRFNEVAGEFQQFQVLLQRFLEDEPFRNSDRVQNYVKNRCVNRRLLQVPVIREDSPKDKMKQRTESTSKDAVTSVIIIEMIEESIRLLWQLVRTDKEVKTTRALHSRKAAQVDLQNPEDATLLLEVQETLRKKQKRLKELTRSECCILKKLQRKQRKQNYAGRVLCFFSEVDMKLISRVLNMKRLTTDQLAWCSSKLENIEFVDNRIKREPSFLLFPCS
ncbi:hypothetical protein V2J09_017455 [Rumex salicifolius]